MRPTKLSHWETELLVTAYDKERARLKKQKNCNQFYIANQLKKLFNPELGYRENYRKAKAAEVENFEKLVLYFKSYNSIADSLSYYLYEASPAAIVQMVKRIKIKK
jgi:hypothetical protein